MDIQKIISFLRNYDGKELTFMEVCGTHTAAISENGIHNIVSDRIHLISGPGCPVCVTVADYIDRLVELCKEENTCVVTFGDMIRVRGSRYNLREAAADGGQVQMVYSPLEIIELARKNPAVTYVFAAVGFETTTPIYAILIQEIEKNSIQNIRLLTALKTMPAVIDRVCSMTDKIDGFIAPGHVSVITGSDIFMPLSIKYNLPFIVAGFEGEELLCAIYALVKLNNQAVVRNMYPKAVTDTGNIEAKNLVKKYFKPCDASWRGMGIIEESGLVLKKEYSKYDAGSEGLVKDHMANTACSCGKVITGQIPPVKCPLYGNVCTPDTPQGACMVSTEGSCYNYYINQRG